MDDGVRGKSTAADAAAGSWRSSRSRRLFVAGGVVAALIVTTIGFLAGGKYTSGTERAASGSSGAQTPSPSVEVSASQRPSSTASTSPAVASTSASSVETSIAPSPTASIPMVNRAVPVVYCPTGDGIDPQPTDPKTPSRVMFSQPRALAGKVALYRDYEGIDTLLAPIGWRCEAGSGADASYSLEVWPPTSTDAAATGITLSSTGGCAGCALDEACPYFVTAADTVSGNACSTPAGEQRTVIAPNTVSLVDPPTKTAPYPTIRRLIFHPSSPSLEEIRCALPSTMRDICEVNQGRTSGETASYAEVRASPAPSSDTRIKTVLTVNHCPTDFGVSPQATNPVPDQVTADLPPGLVGKVELYRDANNWLSVLGPAGWSCQALDAADGATSVIVYPADRPLARDSGGLPDFPTPYTSREQEAVFAHNTSACQGCRLDLACPLMYDAGDAAGLPPCAKAPPQSEQIRSISVGTMEFDDPPGVAGDAAPSGGSLHARGRVLYYPGDTAYEYTCTLPDSMSAVCDVVLDWYTTWNERVPVSGTLHEE